MTAEGEVSFAGFRTGGLAVTLPAQFFVELLPAIEDEAELRVTLYALYAIARTAWKLHVQEVVMGASARFKPDTQLENFAMHWGTLAGDEDRIKVRVLSDQNDLRAEL